MVFNPLYYQFGSCGSRSTAGITAIVYSYRDLIKIRNIRKKDKTLKENTSPISFFIRSVAVKIMQFVPAVIHLFQFYLSESNKNTALLVQ